MKLLIEVPSWLGDTVMCTPAIENIIKILNKPDITLIGPLSSIKLFENNNHITKTFVLERKNSNLNRFAKNLGRFDIFISFRGSIRSKRLRFIQLVIQANAFFRISNIPINPFQKVEGFIRIILQ